MPEYIPSPRDWVREQVELYERTNGAEGNTLRDTGLPVITNIGHKHKYWGQVLYLDIESRSLESATTIFTILPDQRRE